MKLDIKSLAISAGIFWGVGVLLYTWWIILLEGSSGDTTIIGRVYLGYNISFSGSLIGFVWAFFDGIIGGAIFAWLYNKLSARLS
jgi:hypothetical protein